MEEWGLGASSGGDLKGAYLFRTADIYPRIGDRDGPGRSAKRADQISIRQADSHLGCRFIQRRSEVRFTLGN